MREGDGKPSVTGANPLHLGGIIRRFQASRYDGEGDGKSSVTGINSSRLREIVEECQTGRYDGKGDGKLSVGEERIEN